MKTIGILLSIICLSLGADGHSANSKPQRQLVDDYNRRYHDDGDDHDHDDHHHDDDRHDRDYDRDHDDDHDDHHHHHHHDYDDDNDDNGRRWYNW